jgi:WD40 repeat protein/serine/threonine protein kinase
MIAEQGKAKTIFLQAAEIASANERQAFIASACGTDETLRREVEELLGHHQQLGSFLESPAACLPSPLGGRGDGGEGVPVTIDEPAVTERPGTIIGSYKLLEQIGEGGFGVVFMAEQTHPVRRKVALKVLKPGMDSRQVVARFEAERQALALMDHPNIAHVFDGGETETGRPYFVMELVRGIPITDFCDQNHLSVRERLELFIHVCQAVQHAHQKGIIHRDIKPSNVMVTLQDGASLVKVIDFGIAKAMGQQLTDKTLFTNFAQLVGTPLYMSPEQAALSNVDVDTRSDIYSLGVLLYELLTGTTPFDKDRFKEAGYDAIRRIIREEEPPKPSTRISTLGQSAKSISTQRHSDAKRLSQLFRGELDWIVMKALEKDRNRRYESASALAADVQRYLDDEPVQACPPSAGYRLRKFARRNKVALVTASMISVAALLAVGSLVGTVRVLADSNAQIQEEQKQTKDALGRETQANDELIRSLKREERTAYFRRIALAERELTTGNTGHAEELLDDCPLGLQGWEWNYLKRRRHSEPLTFRGHKAWIIGVAFSPDGKRIASASSLLSNTIGEIKIWDRATGKELLPPMLGHFGPVVGVAYSPDGKTLASAGWDKTVKLWNAATGKPLHTLPGHTAYLSSVAFSPDSKVVASASGDNTTKLWDAATGQLLDTLRGHSRALSAVAFSPDGKYLASASYDRTVKLWDMTSHKEMRTLHGQASLVLAVAVSRDSKLVASVGSGGNVMVWDATNGRHLHTFRAEITIVTSVAFNHDGSRLAVGNLDKTVRLFDLVTGQEAITLRGHADMVMSVTFSPDGQQLASASMDGTVKVWDAEAGEAKTNPENRTLRSQAGAVFRMAFSLDGKRLATANYDETVTIWDLASGRQDRLLIGHSGPVFAVAFASDGRRLASADLAGNIKIWDAGTGKEVRTFTSFGGNMALSADGKRLAAGFEGATVFVWDVATGKEELSFHAHEAPILYTAISPDGLRLATSSWDSTVKVWDATKGRKIHELRGHSHIVSAVVFSQDGKRLASASWDKTAKVWDAVTGKELFMLKGHTDRALSVAFSPDGKLLATASLDNNVKIWDAISGKELDNLREHMGWVLDVAFSPDGKWLAAAGGYRGKGEVRLWDTAQWKEKPDGR